jgi:hypothetical protein
MADVVVDANVLVGLMDEHDSLFAQATSLLQRLDGRGTFRSCSMFYLAKPSRCSVVELSSARRIHPTSREHCVRQGRLQL